MKEKLAEWRTTMISDKKAAVLKSKLESLRTRRLGINIFHPQQGKMKFDSQEAAIAERNSVEAEIKNLDSILQSYYAEAEYRRWKQKQ